MIQTYQSDQSPSTWEMEVEGWAVALGYDGSRTLPAGAGFEDERRTQAKEQKHPQKLEKVRDQILPDSPEGSTPAHILTSAL